MPDKDHWNQVNKFNQNPLNQEAKRWLRLAKQQVHVYQMHVYQLLLWGLEQPSLQFKSKDRQNQLQDQAAVLADLVEPKAALAYLVLLWEDPQGPPAVDKQSLQLQRTPEGAAGRLIDQLDTKMSSDPALRGVYPPDQLLASQPD